MRVLLVAPTASKKFGGEAILPVHWFRTLRGIGADAELLTHARARDELSQLFPDDLDRIHFVEDTWLHRWLDAPSRWLPRRLHEVSFAMALDLATQRDIRRAARRLVAEKGVDVIHVPTPVSPRAPSLLSFSVPTVFGPMNGGMAYPPAFRHRDSLATRVVVKLGRMAAFWSSLVFRGKRNADLLLVANERSRQSLPGTLHKVPCELMVENGVQTDLWKSQREVHTQSHDAKVIRLITIGRLVDCKAIDQLLHAIAGLDRSLAVHLDVIGDGPQRTNLEELSLQLELGERVTFHGFLSQETCCRHLEEADIFLLPSLHECGGAAVLESMACGVPVIAANWGGPADYLTGDGVNGNYGVLVEPTEEYVLGLQEAIVELANDEDKRRQLVDIARKRVHEAFDWNVKGQEMLEVYKRVSDTC